MKKNSAKEFIFDVRMKRKGQTIGMNLNALNWQWAQNKQPNFLRPNQHTIVFTNEKYIVGKKIMSNEATMSTRNNRRFDQGHIFGCSSRIFPFDAVILRLNVCYTATSWANIAFVLLWKTTVKRISSFLAKIKSKPLRFSLLLPISNHTCSKCN